MRIFFDTEFCEDGERANAAVKAFSNEFSDEVVQLLMKQKLEEQRSNG